MEMMEEASGSTTLISTHPPTYSKCKRFETKENVGWVTGLPGKLDVECECVNIASRLNVYSFMYTSLLHITLYRHSDHQPCPSKKRPRASASKCAKAINASVPCMY